MKHWIIAAALVCFCGSANAQTADQSFSDLLAAKAKEMRPAVLIGPYTAPAYSLWLPVWSIHGAYDKDASGAPISDINKDIVEFGAGGKYESSDKRGSAFLGFDFNIVALSGKLWAFPWADAHVKRSKFPSIFLGPVVTAPLDWRSYKNANIGSYIKENSRVMASMSVALGK